MRIFRKPDLADAVAEIANVNRSEAKRLIKSGAVVMNPPDFPRKPYYKEVDLKELKKKINE